MPVTSSSYMPDNYTQASGHRWVQETHVINGGPQERTSQYLAPASWTATEMAARLSQTAAKINAALADAEARNAVVTDAMPAFIEQTASQFAGKFWLRVREAQENGNKELRDMLLWWITNRLAVGDITDAAARSTFNTAFGRSLSAAQWTTLRSSKITPAHDRYAAMLVGDL